MRIRIAIGSIGKTKVTTSVEAVVFGDWAAHAAVGDRTGWSVTHIPTGRSASHQFHDLDMQQAVHAAMRLATFIEKIDVDINRDVVAGSRDWRDTGLQIEAVFAEVVTGREWRP